MSASLSAVGYIDLGARIGCAVVLGRYLIVYFSRSLVNGKTCFDIVGVAEIIRRAAPAGTDPAVLEAIHTHYQGDYPFHCADQTRRYPGVDTLLAALRDAGVALGIISNKTEATSQRIAAHFFPDIPFRMVWGNNGERPLKPAADAGQLACAQLGLPAGAVAYVGDSDVDMRFAQQSGFLAVGAAWGYRGAEELTAAGADWLCADAGALLARLRDALPALR